MFLFKTICLTHSCIVTVKSNFQYSPPVHIIQFKIQMLTRDCQRYRRFELHTWQILCQHICQHFVCWKIINIYIPTPHLIHNKLIFDIDMFWQIRQSPFSNIGYTFLIILLNANREQFFQIFLLRNTSEGHFQLCYLYSFTNVVCKSNKFGFWKVLSNCSLLLKSPAIDRISTFEFIFTGRLPPY